MAHLYIKELAGAFVAWVIFIQVRNYFRWRSLRKWGETMGCKDVPTVPNYLPGGIERWSIIFKDMKKLDFLEDFIRSRYKSMGVNTFRMHNVFNTSIISTAEPENIQAILATKFHDFDLGPMRRELFLPVLGNGIFTAEGEAWAHFRHQLKPQFTRDQVSDLEAADRHLNVLFKVLPQESASGWVEATDVLPLLYRFTMDVATEFLFGQSVNSQSTALHSQDSGNSSGMEEDRKFAEALNYAQEVISYQMRVRFLSKIVPDKKYVEACKIVKAFADRFVQRAVAPDYKTPESQTNKYVLLNELVKETRDPIELRDQVLHILLAGRDTTAALLSWCIILLARNPEDFKRIRAAVVSQFGTEKNPIAEPTFASLKACKEVNYLMHESLRLYPLVPMNSRFALKDTVLPTGGGPDRKSPIVVKKGEVVGYMSYVMHRRKDLWGEDADEFRPGRWEGRKLGWDFIAFSGGPRICLGQQYALNETAFVLVRFLQRYDEIEALDMVSPIKKHITITLSPSDVKVRLHRASK